MSHVDLTVRCRPWGCEGTGTHRVRVDLDNHPRVRVWDPVGKIYTVCHSLAPRAEARIIRLAREAGASDRPESEEES